MSQLGLRPRGGYWIQGIGGLALELKDPFEPLIGDVT